MLILPGGRTRCIFDDSGPFAFQVFAGKADKILFYFQGGGACWDQFSTDLDLCSSSSFPQAPIGIFDKTHPNNAFAEYTMYACAFFFPTLSCFSPTFSQLFPAFPPTFSQLFPTFFSP
jgi:hypothetical protein